MDQEKIAAGMAAIQKSMADQAIREKKVAAQKDIIEISTKTFDKAQSYTNIVIIGGYAGAFTIWANVKTMLTQTSNVWIASLLLVSLVIFVGWEVGGMIVRAVAFSNMEGLASWKDQATFEKALQDYKTNQQRFSLLAMKIWPFVLVTTITPAIGALGMLGYNFITLLVGAPNLPK